ATLEHHLYTADALLDDLPAGFPSAFDVLLGNPPFASVFARASAGRPGYTDALRRRYASARRSFDLSVPFVERSMEWGRSGGQVGLVLPNKLLSADYARVLRERLNETAAVEAMIDFAGDHAFDAQVYPVVLVLRRGPAEASAPLSLFRSQGGVPALIRRGVQADLRGTPGASWNAALDPDWPHLRRFFEGTIPLGEVATLSAGMTVAEAYTLRDAVYEQANGQPESGALRLVTSGVIERYSLGWGERPVRFLSRTYRRPLIPAEVLPARRLEQARSAKIIISGMGQSIRAALDDGRVQPAVATVMVTASDWPLEVLCVLLNSGLLSRVYRALFGGLALNGGYLRYGKRELAQLPLPAAIPSQYRMQALARLAQLPDGSRAVLDRAVENLYR
ncbi:MAG: N-6 DNA methylase, partial [Anaerolineae bacterium]|nr:N-6 DNA methylase [Anaerolineae bacterium]